MDSLGSQHLFSRDVVELSQKLRGRLDRPLFADQVKGVTPIGDLYTEPALDLSQMLVELATDIRQALVVRWLQIEVDRLQPCGHVHAAVSAAAPIHSPRNELGSASVIRTSAKSPISDIGAVKLTTRLFSVRPAS